MPILFKTKNKYIQKSKQIISATKKRIVIWVVAFVTCTFFSFLMDPFNEDIIELMKTSIWNILVQFFYGIVFAIFISEISIFIDKILEKRLPWNDKTIKRLIIQCIFQVLGSLSFSLLAMIIIDNTIDLPKIDYKQEYTYSAQFLATTLVVSMLISFLNTIDYLAYNWKKTALEASKHKLIASEHKRAVMALELQALKLQIDPHFIFNNLSVLSELILENQQLGYEYSESFSKVYRYILINSKKDTVTLEEECKFLKSYIFLITKRLDSGISFSISLDDKYKSFILPSLTLQLLVENTLKHNKTLKSNPLQVDIYTTEDNYLVVRNSLIPLKNNDSSGFGLENIINRYKFLGDKQVMISKTDKEFIAKIPLYENK